MDIATLVQQQHQTLEGNHNQGQKEQDNVNTVASAEGHAVDRFRGEAGCSAKEIAVVAPDNDSVGDSSTQCSDVIDDDNEEEETDVEESGAGGWIMNPPVSTIIQHHQAFYTTNGYIALPNPDSSNFSDVRVKDSSNVHLGNEVNYNGPVTINQFVYTNSTPNQDAIELDVIRPSENISNLSTNKDNGAPNGCIFPQYTELNKAMETGRSKKEAKHAAAKAVLDKLIGVNTDGVESPLPNSLPDSQNLQELQTYGEEKIVNNPIGALQEMCMSRHWPPPKYTMEGEEGLPHERQFTIVCSILKYREVGQGKSKKVAKRHAAHKMWQALHDMNNQAPSVDEDEIVQRNANVSARYADLKGSKISTLTTIHSIQVSKFHKSLKSSTGVKLFQLQNTCFNDGDVNLVQFLQEIASEQQFEVTYVDIEEKSISGKFQCLVQLSTLPVAVCYGCGVTSKDAQASAAQNALEYLKIMTKK